MGLISYPRTAAELKAVLSLGYQEVLRLLRANKLRVNLRGFLSHLFKENRYDELAVDLLNERLLDWHSARKKAGLPDTALVYHHTGVRCLHGFKIVKFQYQKKPDRQIYEKERNQEFRIAGKTWLKEIATKQSAVLEAAGIPKSEIDRMAKYGTRPMDANGRTYQVHHRIPLDDGGTNDPKNFILIRNDVEHRAVHGFYNPAELRIDQLANGDTAEVAFPLPPEDTIIYPNPSLGYVSEVVPNTTFLEIFDET